MTVNNETLTAGPFATLGGTQVLPFEFKVFAADEVEVIQVEPTTLVETVVSPATYTVQINTLPDGTVSEGGSVTVTDADYALGDLYVRAAPDYSQEQIWSDDGSRLRSLNEALDRAALRDLDLKRRLGLTVAMPLFPEPGYLAIDADGRTVIATGTGADGALRTDLGGSDGSSLVGTIYGGSVETALIQAMGYGSQYHRDFPPGCNGLYCGDVWPTQGYVVAAMRMGASGEFILARVWHDDGIVEELILRDPMGWPSASPVAGGWMLWSHRAFLRDGRLKPWHTSPLLQIGAIPNTDFAVRIGPISEPYASANDGPIWANAGFGHGRMTNVPANNQIILDGAGANLQSLVNWPIGVKKFGNRLTVTCNFKLKYYADGTEAVNLDYAQQFGKDTGGFNRVYLAQASFGALIAGVGWQDSPIPMFAAQRSAHVDRAKLSGHPEVVLNGDGVQKGNWTGPGTTGQIMQFYLDADDTVIAQCEALYGPPMRENNVAVSPAWKYNNYGRVHVTDDGDNAKFRFYLNSSEQTLPRTAWPMPVGTTFSTYATWKTVIRPTGPL